MYADVRVYFETGHQARMLWKWSCLPDVNVITTSHDVSDQSAVEDLIAHAQKIAPVGGAFHLAAVSLSLPADII